MDVTRIGAALKLPRSFGIGGRMAALVCALVAGITATGGAWTYVRLRDGLLREEFSRQSAAAMSAGVYLTSGIDVLRRDVAILADTPAVQGFIRARRAGGVDPLEGFSERQWRNRLTEMFEGVMLKTPSYLQIRLIGVEDSGLELARVWSADGKPVLLPADRLEHRHGQPYFDDTILLPPGAVNISDPIHNSHLGPTTKAIPTMWAATPVRDPDGEVFGILVVDTDFGPRIRRMKESLDGRYEPYMFNEQGSFLVHPDPSPTLETKVGTPFGVRENAPPFWKPLITGGAIQSVLEDPFSHERIAATLLPLHFDPDRPERYYSLLLTADYRHVIAQSIQVRNETIFLACLMILAMLFLVLAASRKVTRPLREMITAVQDFSDGAGEIKLPVRARDEAGVLARAFSQMILYVRRHAAALEAEVGDRTRAEQALRLSERRLRFALGAARAAAWEWDLATDETSWDESVEETLAIDRKTFRGTVDSWLELMHPDDAGAIQIAKRQALEENQPFAVDFRIQGRAGGWRHWVSRGDIMRDEGGRPVKLVGIFWDATEAKAAQDQVRQYADELERKNREMEQFVYSVSHDLKSPLVTCKGFIGILREDLADGNSEAALESVTRLERASQRMSRLIEDLLQLSRVGRVENDPQMVAVSPLVSQLADDLDRATGTGVSVEVQPDMPLISADPRAIERLFQNLLTNAFVYGCEGPDRRIEVGSKTADREVLFFVRDHGPGIPLEHQEKVFGLFQRLDSRNEGTGIGLTIVVKIMEVHGGRVWVESAPGEGATFWLSFPDSILVPAQDAAEVALKA